MKDPEENSLKNERREYHGEALSRADLPESPLTLFKTWLAAAQTAELIDATAMTLATVGADGAPQARIVLLKGCDEEGYVFFSDYRSEKGAALEGNAQAELLFYWRELHRQVRIRGDVVKVSAADSAAYFDSRPLESQISAAASVQSEVIESRARLEASAEQLRTQGGVQRPEFWGGYRVQARRYEFWQGRENRLHDRFRYTLRDEGWAIDRLQP